jgi:hypothetical protein
MFPATIHAKLLDRGSNRAKCVLSRIRFVRTGAARRRECEMSEAKSSMHPRGSLNEYQARRLRVTCQYIDKLLGDMESMLNLSHSKTVFPRYSADVSPEQRRTIEEYIARLRAQIVRVLEAQGIAAPQAPIPALHAITVALDAIGIEIEELMPEHMRGYGDLPEAAASELNGIVDQLRGLTAEFEGYLRGVKPRPSKPV